MCYLYFNQSILAASLFFAVVQSTKHRSRRSNSFQCWINGHHHRCLRVLGATIKNKEKWEKKNFFHCHRLSLFPFVMTSATVWKQKSAYAWAPGSQHWLAQADTPCLWTGNRIFYWLSDRFFFWRPFFLTFNPGFLIVTSCYYFLFIIPFLFCPTFYTSFRVVLVIDL